MKITLISPYPDVTAFGIRTLSALLRENGHDTRLVFLPDPQGNDFDPHTAHYGPGLLDELSDLCRDSGLIGLTLMTNYFHAAREITAHLKRNLNIPVLWGGVHPTVRPAECTAFADYSCIGEGEEALLELVTRLESGREVADMRNIALQRDGKVIVNPPRPLERNLDRYPTPDYSCKDHYAMHEGRIQPLDHALLKQLLSHGAVSAYLGKIGYQTMTGRGCPHHCTYCINDAVRNLYETGCFLRWRSTEHTMRELRWVKENMPYVGYFWISDDAFFAHPPKAIKEFCDAYKQQIGMPFTCLASPLTITEEKMEMMVDAGMIYLQMGVQSGSARIQELFNRKSMSNKRVLEVMHIINKFKDRMFPPSYDFILDVPYETDADKVDSLRLMSQIPKPFRLQLFALVLYPGTKLHEMAKADGLIGDETTDIYAKSFTMQQPSYLNLLVTLFKRGRMPGGLLRLFISKPALLLFNNRASKIFFRYFYVVLRSVHRLAKRMRGKQ